MQKFNKKIVINHRTACNIKVLLQKNTQQKVFMQKIFTYLKRSLQEFELKSIYHKNINRFFVFSLQKIRSLFEPLTLEDMQSNQQLQFSDFQNYFKLTKYQNRLNLFTPIGKNDEDRIYFSKKFNSLKTSNYDPTLLKLSEKQSRAIGVMLGMAICDALGASTQFLPFRYQGYGLIKNGFGDIEYAIKKGQLDKRHGQVGIWTDDASMGVVMGYGLMLNDYLFDPIITRKMFHMWWYNGLGNGGRYQSIGLGGNISISIQQFAKNPNKGFTKTEFQDNNGNGSLMRLAPIPIVFHQDLNKACKVAMNQSLTTHNGLQAKQCARLLTEIIINLINRKKNEFWEDVLLKTCDDFRSQLKEVEYLARGLMETSQMFISNTKKYQSFEKCNKTIYDRNWNWRSNYFKYSPTRLKQSPKYIGSYCMDALAMALHFVFFTKSFKDCAILVADMGGDCDTVGAIAGQITGAIYGVDKGMLQLYSEMEDFKKERYEVFLLGYKLFHKLKPTFQRDQLFFGGKRTKQLDQNIPVKQNIIAQKKIGQKLIEQPIYNFQGEQNYYGGQSQSRNDASHAQKMNCMSIQNIQSNQAILKDSHYVISLNEKKPQTKEEIIYQMLRNPLKQYCQKQKINLSHNYMNTYSLIDSNDLDRHKYKKIFKSLQKNKFNPQYLNISFHQSKVIAVMLGLGIGNTLGSKTSTLPFVIEGHELITNKFSDVQKATKQKNFNPNYFNQKQNIWTIDTSITIALAYSLILNDYEFNPNHSRFMYHFCQFHGLGNGGRFQSIQCCGSIKQSFEQFYCDPTLTYAKKESQNNNGNGTLMRLASVPIVYKKDVKKAMEVAANQSLTTHNGLQAKECCRLLTYIIVRLINRKENQKCWNVLLTACESFESKIESVKYLAKSKQQTQEMFESKYQVNASFREWNKEVQDRNWDWKDKRFQYSPYRLKINPITIGSYCMDALAMALHVIYFTDSFKQCVIKIANMGGDCDTVGAIAGQIAGAIYGVDKGMLQLYSEMKDFKKERYELFLLGVKLANKQKLPMKERQKSWYQKIPSVGSLIPSFTWNKPSWSFQ